MLLLHSGCFPCVMHFVASDWECYEIFVITLKCCQHSNPLVVSATLFEIMVHIIFLSCDAGKHDYMMIFFLRWRVCIKSVPES
jgi:hypothetical protein